MTAPIPSGLAEALTSVLGGVTKKPQDAAVVRLAITYAEQLDADPELLVKLGPQFLAVLESLGMTPRARAAIMAKGGRNDGDSGAEHDGDCKCLPCQRKRRALWRDRAATVDAPSG